MERAKRMLAAVLAMVMVFAGLPMYGMEVKAEEVLTEGDYQYKVVDNGVEITKYTGSGGEVTIPSEIDGKKVTSIGWSAFWECSILTSVTIPDSVTNIGSDAFKGCAGLMSINIPSGVTNIGGGAFDGCSGLTSINIPSSVTSIGSYTF